MHDLHNPSTAYYARGALRSNLPLRQHLEMPKPPKRKPPLENFKAWREKKGLNQTQLAERMDTDQPTVSKWERGVVPMTLGIVHAYAEALDIEPEDFWRHPDAPISELVLLDRKLDPRARARIVRIVKAALDAA